jgi:ribosomal-protein-alanine N-acetyltransferase
MPSRIIVRRPLKTDQKEFVAAVLRSTALHRVWVRAPSTAAQYRTYLQRQDGRSHWAFLVCRRDAGALAGAINISNAVRGSFHSAYLGYYAFTPHDRQPGNVARRSRWRAPAGSGKKAFRRAT